MNIDLESLRRLAFDALPVLLDAAAKGLVLLAVAGVLVLAMRKASAAARQVVWLLALAALIVLPLASAALPSWGILPGWVKIEIAEPAAPVAADNADSTADTAIVPPADPLRGADQADAHAGAPPSGQYIPAGTPSAPAAAIEPAPLADGDSAPTTAATAKPATPARTWRSWVIPSAVAAWLTGALVCLLPLILGRISLWRLARRSRRIDVSLATAKRSGDGWTTLLHRAAQAIGLRRPITLLQSSDEPMPMVWGTLQPKLLLPAEAEDWTIERRWVVLLHELAHAKRRDCLAKLIAHVACAFYWFNPLCWIAFKLMQREAEAACDDLVLSCNSTIPSLRSLGEAGQPVRPSDYAQHLLEIASGLKSGMLAGYSSIAMARKSKLEGRLLAILDATRNRRALTRIGILVAAALVVAVAIPLALLRAAEPQTAGMSAVSAWAKHRGWNAKEVEKTTLESRWGGWRNLPFELDSAEEADAKACDELAKKIHFLHNGNSEFNDEATRLALEKILRDRPEYFYAEFLLGIWHRNNDNATKSKEFLEAAYKHAPVIIVQRYELADRSPLQNGSVQRFALECNRVKRGSLDPSLVLDYCDLRTDEEGCIYLPAYDTVFRWTNAATPEGHRAEYPRLGWFQATSKVAFLPVCKVEPSAARQDHRKFSTFVVFINNKRYGPTNGASSVPPTGGVQQETGKSTCGRPGAVSEVEWKYLRTTDAGDEYEVIRRFPIDTSTPNTEKKTITYNGQPLTVFEDDMQRVLFLSPDDFEKTQSDATGSASQPTTQRVDLNYSSYAMFPVADAGITVVHIAANGNLRTGWTGLPKGELEFDEFRLVVGAIRDHLKRPQGMLLTSEAGKAIPVVSLLVGDVTAWIREVAKDQKSHPHVGILLPDANLATIETVWRALPAEGRDRWILLVPAKMPDESRFVKLAAERNSAASKPATQPAWHLPTLVARRYLFLLIRNAVVQSSSRAMDATPEQLIDWIEHTDALKEPLILALGLKPATEQSVVLLSRLLSSSDPRIKLHAARAFALWGRRDSVDILRDFAAGKERWESDRAAEALLALGERLPVPQGAYSDGELLTTVLKAQSDGADIQGSPTVMRQLFRNVLRASLVLDATGWPDKNLRIADTADERIRQIDTSTNPRGRRVATLALGLNPNDPTVTAKLVELLKDEDPWVALHAARWLALRGQRECVAVLMKRAAGGEAISSSEFERNDAAWALLAMGAQPPRDSRPYPDPLVEQVVLAANRLVTQPADEWGKANNGVQVRLRADKHTWAAGQTPTFRVDIRNAGKLIVVPQPMSDWELELDGSRYAWTGMANDVTPKRLPPEGSGSATIPLTAHWVRVAKPKTDANDRSALGDERLQLTPGRHSMRIIAFCYDDNRSGLAVESNAVEFEIAAEGARVSELTFEALSFHGFGRPIKIETNWSDKGNTDFVGSSPFLTWKDGRAVFTGFVRDFNDDSVVLVASVDLQGAPFADIPAGKKVTIPRTATVRIHKVVPTSQPAGSKLEFRIAPKPSDLGKAELTSYMDWLKAGKIGFWQNRPINGRYEAIAGKVPAYAWLPISGELTNTPQLVTGEYNGQKYVLVADKPGQTMVPGEGKDATWGLARVFADNDQLNEPAVRFVLDARGAELFAALTKANINNAVAIVVDDKIVSAPIIRAALGKTGIITGKFTEQEAADLAAALRAGMPPASQPATQPVDEIKPAADTLEQWLKGKEVADICFAGPHMDLARLRDYVKDFGSNDVMADPTFILTTGEGGGENRAFVSVQMKATPANIKRLLSLQEEMAKVKYKLDSRVTRVWSYQADAKVRTKSREMAPQFMEDVTSLLKQALPGVNLTDERPSRTMYLAGKRYQLPGTQVSGMIRISAIEPSRAWELNVSPTQTIHLPYLGLIVATYYRPGQVGGLEDDSPQRRAILAAVKKAAQPLIELDGGAVLHEWPPLKSAATTGPATRPADAGQWHSAALKAVLARNKGEARTSRINPRGKTVENLRVVEMAIEDYLAAFGKHPDSLEALQLPAEFFQDGSGRALAWSGRVATYGYAEGKGATILVGMQAPVMRPLKNQGWWYAIIKTADGDIRIDGSTELRELAVFEPADITVKQDDQGDLVLALAPHDAPAWGLKETLNDVVVRRVTNDRLDVGIIGLMLPGGRVFSTKTVVEVKPGGISLLGEVAGRRIYLERAAASSTTRPAAER